MDRSILNRLPDELLLIILRFAMMRNSPFLIENRRKPPMKSATNATCRYIYRKRKMHGRHIHISDWITINSTCRRIRRIGRQAFFSVKVIAMSSKLANDLLRSDRKKYGFARVLLDARDGNPKNNLNLIQHLVLTDADWGKPWMNALPGFLASFFPNLKRCVLLYGFEKIDYRSRMEQDYALSIPVAVCKPMCKRNRDKLLALGLREKLILENIECIEPEKFESLVTGDYAFATMMRALQDQRKKAEGKKEREETKARDVGCEDS